MSERLPEVLLHLPGSAGGAVASALAPHARVERVESRGAFLSALGRDRPWRIAIHPVQDEPDRTLVARMAGALREGLLVLTHPDPTVERVVAAESAGAAFLLRHPVDPPSSLVRLLAPYLEESGGHPLSEGAGAESGVVGSSPALTEAYRTAARVAATPATVLILGESGTGKELVARALHRRSDRSGGAFVAVNCAALPEGLLEAELFGYERGAFTGAVGRSDGRFGRADGGTLFLDEVGEMGLSAQAKLLRALETGEVERLGGSGPVTVDARLVAATNRDLEARVREGAFREDLLYRITVVTIRLPPLRQRTEDLLPLALHFAGEFSRRYGRHVRALSRPAVDHLRERTWPGNVRELRNVMDQAVLLCRGGVIRSVDVATPEDDAPRISPLGDGLDPAYPATLSLKEVEERHIRRVLQHTGGHMAEAAAILGIHRNTMTAKVRDFRIEVENPARKTG